MSLSMLDGTSGKGLWKGADRCSANTCLLPLHLLPLARECRGHATNRWGIKCPEDHKHMLRTAGQKERKILSPQVTEQNLCSSPDHLTPACHSLRKVKQFIEQLLSWVPVLRSQTQFLTCSGILQAKWETAQVVALKIHLLEAGKLEVPVSASHGIWSNSWIGREMEPGWWIVLLSHSRPA